MLLRKSHLLIWAIILIAGISSAGIAFAQTPIGAWSVTPQYPNSCADSPDGWRVCVALGHVTVSNFGVDLSGGTSQVAVNVNPSRAGMPAYLPAGNYKITLKVKTWNASNYARLYATTDSKLIPNPLTGRQIAQCPLPAAATPVLAECTGTYTLAQSSYVKAYFTVDQLSQFVSLTFTKPEIRALRLDEIPK